MQLILPLSCYWLVSFNDSGKKDKKKKKKRIEGTMHMIPYMIGTLFSSLPYPCVQDLLIIHH